MMYLGAVCTVTDVYSAKLGTESPKAFSFNSAVCEQAGTVHFSKKAYVGNTIYSLLRMM
jgi:hypothetical protein